MTWVGTPCEVAGKGPADEEEGPADNEEAPEWDEEAPAGEDVNTPLTMSNFLTWPVSEYWTSSFGQRLAATVLLVK